jgi:predicted  nucleic acid-binding Zn-ribbon protein
MIVTFFSHHITSQEHMLTVESQLRDLEKKDALLAQLAAEKAVMEGAVDAAKNAQTALERQISELKEEKTVIQEQLRSGGDSARVLDEYKKRAQMALKKVRTCLLLIPSSGAVGL